jgi:hypothetical protein
MKSTLKTAAIAALAAAVLAGPAQAALLYTLPAATGQMGSSTVSATFDAGAGDGSATFRLDGYASLDGDNSVRDLFTLSLNGVRVLNAYIDMGGGGASYVFNYSGPSSLTFARQSPGIFLGGTADFFVPLTFVEGSNTLSFTYALDQGDEAWGLGAASISGNAYVAPGGGVPEPGAWALMIAGFGMAGSLLRRRRVAVG